MPRKQQNDVLADVVLTLLKVLWSIIALPWRLITQKSAVSLQSHTKVSLDRSYIDQQWQEVQTLLGLAGPAHFRQAVVQADKLLDYVLKGLGMSGQTLGERLKAARHLLSPDTNQKAWSAHKLRNRIVHEADEVMSWEAQAAIRDYERVLSELNVLSGASR